MEQVRRLLAELTRDDTVADRLRENPAELVRALELSDEDLDALRSADRFFVDERPVVDKLVDRTGGRTHSPHVRTPQAAVPDTSQHSCGCDQSVAAIVAELTSLASKAIETIESIHREQHIDDHRHRPGDFDGVPNA